jgi:TRAP-type C4-dicarboxylate transport system permease small subunit
VGALRRIEETLAVLLLAVLLVVMGLQVFTRYVLGAPLVWTEEAARWLYVWVVFLGAAACVADRGHVAITMLADRLPPWPRALLALAMNLLCLAVLAVLVRVGGAAALRVWDQEAVTFQLSLGWLYLPVPVCAAAMLVRLLITMAEDLRAARAGRTVSHAERSIT